MVTQAQAFNLSIDWMRESLSIMIYSMESYTGGIAFSTKVTKTIKSFQARERILQVRFYLGRDENISKNGRQQRWQRQWLTSDVDCRPVEKLSLVDVDREKLSGVDVDRQRSTFICMKKFWEILFPISGQTSGLYHNHIIWPRYLGRRI